MPKAILCVGMCVLDIIHVCEEFPVEDSDKRSKHGRWQRGGNASNNCTVLAQLGRSTHFLGPLSRSKMFEFVLDDMKQRNIQFTKCPFYDCEVPLSSVLLNEKNGSRTIVHSNPGLPILRASNFMSVELAPFEWIHFEGRDPEETAKMMQRICDFNKSQNKESERIRISLDMEKLRFEFDVLLQFVDLVFLGKDIAISWGSTNKFEAIELFAEKFPFCKCTVICPWGEDGAIARNAAGTQFLATANKAHDIIVDSLGAGDTFAAAVIYSLSRNFDDIAAAIEFGCLIAGDKVGYFGYDCVSAMYEKWKINHGEL